MNVFSLIKIYRRASDVLDIVKEGNMKKLWASKTFWFQLLSCSAAVAGVIPLPPETLAVVVGLINIGLRLVTKDPVSVV